MPNGEEEYKKFLEAVNDECEKKFKKEGNLEAFSDGYKAGFRDGFLTAMIQFGPMSPEDKQRLIEEGAQLGYPRPW